MKTSASQSDNLNANCITGDQQANLSTLKKLTVLVASVRRCALSDYSKLHGSDAAQVTN